jgi:hypothetical protein
MASCPDGDGLGGIGIHPKRKQPLIFSAINRCISRRINDETGLQLVQRVGYCFRSRKIQLTTVGRDDRS